jgi:hypothetical protein
MPRPRREYTPSSIDFFNLCCFWNFNIDSNLFGNAVSLIDHLTISKCFSLALLQGTAFAYVPSVAVFMNLAENKCNATSLDFVPEEIYQGKLQLIQGSLLLSALVPMCRFIKS